MPTTAQDECARPAGGYGRGRVCWQPEPGRSFFVPEAVPRAVPRTGGPEYFECSICHLPRAVYRRIQHAVEASGPICTWCNLQTVGVNYATEMRWCRLGRHELPRAQFLASALDDDLDQDEEDVCRGCQLRHGMGEGNRYVHMWLANGRTRVG